MTNIITSSHVCFATILVFSFMLVTYSCADLRSYLQCQKCQPSTQICDITERTILDATKLFTTVTCREMDENFTLIQTNQFNSTMDNPYPGTEYTVFVQYLNLDFSNIEY